MHLEPPSQKSLMVNLTKTPVIETQSFIATCNLTALKNETITYRWIKDDEETDYKTGVLSLSSVSRNDAGNYICRASNVAGHVDSQKFTLQVHCMYKFLFLQLFLKFSLNIINKLLIYFPNILV